MQHCYTEMSTSENLVILENVVAIEELNRHRTLRIHLPKDYHSSDRRYPVIYMHDGQNLFDPETSYSGDWGVPGHMNHLSDAHEFDAIIVGIDNGAEHRIDELSPWHNEQWGGGNGAIYASFLVNTVKPYIDENYRTLKNRENTAIMGSSLGGLISHYAAIKYPEVFSKAGIFSPSYWFHSAVYNFTTELGQMNDSEIYLLAGGQESFVTSGPVEDMYQHLLALGHPYEQVKVKHVEHGEHSEWFWNSEFTEAVKWLFRLH